MAKDKKGYVAIPRGLFEDLADGRHKFSKIEAFVFLSYHARFAKSDDMLTKVPCKKGQLVTSLRELATAFSWSEAAVRRYLLLLVEGDYIVWTSYKRTTVITMKQIADDADITAEESRGVATCDANCDATYDATSDATCDATCDATNSQGNKKLGGCSDATRDATRDATSDATCDANRDANCDALTRVLSYNSLVRKKEKGKYNVSSRKAGSEKKKSLVSKAKTVFEDFYDTQKVSAEKYYWTAKDGKHMTELLQKIRFSRNQRGMSCEDGEMIKALEAFLSYVTEPWLLSHLSVANLNSKYNEIVASAGRQKGSPAQGMEVGRIITEYDDNKFNDKQFFS